jgi:glyoxylase-like metal-dependent hydrolase (beta-lactamase superfamily II)
MPAKRQLVAPGVLMITAPNPGPKTLEGTNCYLVGNKRQLVIDAGPDMPGFQEELAASTSGEVVAVLLTHDHPDHAGGAPYLGSLLSAPIWINQASPSGRLAGAHVLAADQEFAVEGNSVRVIPSPGHSWDHVCFLREPDRILFAGDTILGEGSTLIAPPEGDVSVYLDSLVRLKALQPAKIAPGHGPMITDPAEKIDEYVTHRRQREQELLAALDNPKTVQQLVDEVYGIDDSTVCELAKLSVRAQLAKLLREKRVEEITSGRYRVRAAS